MASVGIIPVANETKASSSRITREGRKITYVMTVIQQPERARACGSGAKSSADRRPVDPPPIVALHVYEGANAENDITFQYNANFFLFATLENARPMAQGRAPPSSQACPVLTGTPVSGNSYLDRPEPAGYFIFPDLSVRHEGKYRLGFSLYEELKETKDYDADETPQNAEAQKSAHVSHRLEVKSVPFTVFSAKKFPGLSESTPLSKMVAEQGCRVRIRRDVRMRRRETKGGQEFDGYDEENEYARNTRTSTTPDVYVKPHTSSTPQMPPHDADRPRSVSNASQVSHITGRRPSVEQVTQTYQQSAPPQYPTTMAPQAPQGMYPPQISPQWQQSLPPANNFMQPPQSYPQPNYQPPPINGQYNNFAPHQYPTYDHSATFPPPPAGPPVPTSQTMGYPPSNQTMSPYSHVEYGRPMHTHIQPGHPQAMGMQPQYATAPGHSSLGPKHDSISPYQHQAPSTHGNEQHGYYTNASVAPPKFQNTLQPTGATKRTYESSFDVSHMHQPLRQGARPASPQEQKYAYNVDAVDEDPHTPIDEAAMSYRRADGTERRRRLPSMLI